MRILAFIVTTLALFAQPPGPETVVANAHGKDLTVADINRMLDAAGPQYTSRFQQDPAGILQQLLLMQELAAEADKLKLGEQSPLKEQLEFQRQSILAQTMLNREQNGFQVSEDDVEVYYRKLPQRFEQARVKAIVIRFLPRMPQGTSPEAIRQAAQIALLKTQNPGLRSQEEAGLRCRTVFQDLQADGDFLKLMAEYSDDPSGKTGGNFGIVGPASAFPAEIVQAVLDLDRPGTFTHPYSTADACYIFQLVEKSVAPLDEMRTRVILELRNQHFLTWFEGVRKRNEVIVKNREFFMRLDTTKRSVP